MNNKTFIFILGLAGFIVMADNWVVSPILPAIAGKIIAGSSYASFFSLYGGLLAGLLILAAVVIRHEPHLETV